MDYKVMVPSQIWQGYDAGSLPLGNLKTDYVGTVGEDILEERHLFTALETDDGNVTVAVRLLRREGDVSASPVIVMVGEYHRSPDEKLVHALANAGYTIVIPDLSGVGEFKTTFPPSLEYGLYEKAGDHIKKVMPTAKETSQYLYAIIVKRTLTFVKRVISDGKLILMGLGDAVEIAIAVSATEQDKVDGLACINGSGYREYIKQNRYGEQRELVMDEERMCWLTGVASVAYAKHVKAPTFIALGSNARNSDIDRLSNLVALMDNDDVRIAISPRATDFMLPEAYRTLMIWLSAVVRDNTDELPTAPVLKIRVSDSGVPTFNVDCDPSSMIKKVVVYYAEKEYHHEIRNYREADGLSVSYNEYIAEAVEYDKDAPLFAYAIVEYESGLSLSSLVEYRDLKGLPVKEKVKNANATLRVIYQAGEEESGFVEEHSGTVLFEKSLRLVETAKGMVGLTSDSDGLRTYRFCPTEGTDKDRILQLELYTVEDAEAEIILLGVSSEGSKTYKATIAVNNTKGLFMGTRLKITDFKDDNLMPLTNWYGVKALSIRGKQIVVGNILFI
ncbi:MAG: hypothetical protein IJD50_06960 [Clostridia bacterium]|nr:hypothetical protein [Clostridia bacterium]